jgi:molybdopterin-biosynthesis enzyme MoeA-like protein
LEGIAKGLRRKLEVDEKALQMVKEKYETYFKEGKIEKVELTPARVKMATFPKGTEPLHNPVGTAPSMMAKVKQTILIALPGVPPEMEAIFNESVATMLKKETGKSEFFEASIYADHIMESTLAPLIDQAMHDNPYVYMKSHVYTKSHPQTEGQRPHIELHFSTTAESSKPAKARLEKAIFQLSELIEKHGGKISPKKKQNQTSSGQYVSKVKLD